LSSQSVDKLDAWLQIDMELARFRGVNCTLLDEFVCAVCHDVCLEPVQLPCQHLFCIKCISGAVSARSHQQSGAAQCPVCRQSFHGEDVAVSRPIWNFLGKLQVACEFSINGCSAVHAVHDAEHHAGGCPFRPLKCRWCPQVRKNQSTKPLVPWDKAPRPLGRALFGPFLAKISVASLPSSSATSRCFSAAFLSLGSSRAWTERKARLSLLLLWLRHRLLEPLNEGGLEAVGREATLG
jgi:hypothetical protein